MILLLLIACAEPTLGERLKPLIAAYKGTATVAVKGLVTGEAFYHDADRVMPTASLIKLPVLIEAYLQADEGKVSLRDDVTLRDADLVPGSGVLTYHFSDGARFSLRDACRLMIAFSDNTATNLVIDRVSIPAVNARMASWGLKETKLNAKVFRGSTTSVDKERTAKYGLGSTTAREMADLWETLMLGDRVRPALKWAVVGHLKKNDDKDKFPRLLPPGTRVAHKDGAVTAVRTDAGVVFAPGGPIVVVVLTDGNADRRWVSDNAGNLLCAKVARAAYDHFNSPTK
ncbi:MAG: serine hydrolase [Gemmataceae bacterium]